METDTDIEYILLIFNISKVVVLHQNYTSL